MSGGGPAKSRYKHHNPHAHAIHKPGPRLMHSVPLQFVYQRVAGHGGKTVNADLNLTSYIDFLLVTVIFLLSSFSASGEITIDKTLRLPAAQNVEVVVEAPMVQVSGDQVQVDNNLAGRTKAIEDLGRIGKIDELFDQLKRKREVWRQFHPNKPFPGVCILVVDENVSALVVKSVFQTAAYAGYPNVSFMVRRRGAPAG